MKHAKPICRSPREDRDPAIDCVKPLFRKDGRLSAEPDLAAQQARWNIYLEQENAMNAWEADFWEGESELEGKSENFTYRVYHNEEGRVLEITPKDRPKYSIPYPVKTRSR